ncbi:MAG: hypothetical protein V3S45_01905, partial [Kiloniellales bacterium]
SGAGVEDFLGAGNLGRVTAAGETSELRATGLEMSLSGIPAAFISAAFERAQGRAARVWLGFLDGSYQVVADPALIFSGVIDDTAIDLGDTATVTLSVENRIIAWERPKVRRYTNEDQQQRFAGDKVFEFVNPTVEKELLWGTGSTNQVPVTQPAPTAEPTPAPTGGEIGDTSGGTESGGGEAGGSSGGEAGGAGPGDSGSGGLV